MCVLVGCYNAADKPLIEDNLPNANCTMADFRKFIKRGNDNIREPITLRGRVTSSDEEDNFYGSLTVEDGTAAVEVMVGYHTLHGLYPEGMELALTIEGCAAHLTHGVVQIGRRADPSSYYAVDYLETRQRVDEVIHPSLSIEPIAPHNIEICNLGSEVCGRLVLIDSLTLIASSSIDPATMTLDDAIWRGSSLFTDPRGDSIVIFTRNYADFANNPMPQALRSVTGIVEEGLYGGGSVYNLSMRYESDAVAY